jgi:hypothetical protein
MAHAPIQMGCPQAPLLRLTKGDLDPVKVEDTSIRSGPEIAAKSRTYRGLAKTHDQHFDK